MKYEDLQKKRQIEKLIKKNKETKVKTEPNRHRRPVKKTEVEEIDFSLGL